MPNAPDGRPAPRVGLLVTCLVDAIRPRIGFAALQLLEEAGCIVEVPEAQTCCGQPAFNSGGTEAANGLARQVIAAFEPFDYVVVPSGSCAGMIKLHYPGGAGRRSRLGAARQALAAQDVGDHELPRRRPRLPPRGP